MTDPPDLYRAADAPLRAAVARRLAEIARDVGRTWAARRLERAQDGVERFSATGQRGEG